MSSPSENPLRNLIREIHRRSLWQVLGIYLAGSWLAFEIVERIADSAGLPEWIPPFALVLLVIGLPVVLATAYVQEGTPDVTSADSLGELDDILAGDEPSSGTRTPLERLFNWRNALLGGASAFVLLTTVALTWMSVARGDLPTSVASAFSEVGDSGPVEQSVAVLPFENMSGNPDNEYFSDGITEELLNALAQIPDLRVPGRTSSFAFKDQNITIQQIADTLDVAHVLEGSVRRSGDRVLITAQLVDARTDSHVWSETYERVLTDLFAIQREIATAIAMELQGTLGSGQDEGVVVGGTESAEAHEAYLRGRYFWNQRTGESLDAAIGEFERAVDLDPEYAEAWAGLAQSLILMPEYGGVAEARAWTERGIAAAERALSIEPRLGMARAPLGFGLLFLGRWEEANEQLRQAVSLTPSNATAHQWYGTALFGTGRVREGLTHSRRARDLDPVSQVVSTNLGRALRAAGRIDEATDEFRRAMELAPDWPTVWVDLAVAYLDTGRYEEGLDAWLRAASLFEADVSAWEAAYRAAVRYRETGEPQTVPSFSGLMARVALAAKSGDRRFMFDVLEGALREGTPAWLASAHVVYGGHAFQDDPRYQALLEEAGITW